MLLDWAWVYPYLALLALATAGSLGSAEWAWWVVAAIIGVASVGLAVIVPKTNRGGRFAVALTGACLVTAIGLVLLALRPDREPEPRVVLVGADLTDSDLRRAELSGADLTRAVIANVCLAGADLRDAVVIGADFSHSDLSGAHLEGVDTETAAHWPTPAEQRRSSACH